MTAFALLLAAALQAAPVRSANSVARLAAEATALAPGGVTRVALSIKADPHWHTYWRNAGDSGEGPILKWKLSEGLTLGAPEWPFPERIPVGPLVNYGFDELFLAFPLRADADAKGPAVVELDAQWLVCKEECLPARGKFRISLPLRAGKKDPAWDGLAKAAAGRIPARGLDVSAEGTADRILLSGRGAVDGAVFFPADPLVIENAAEQDFSRTADGWTLSLVRAPEAPSPAERLRGVVAAGGKGWDVDVPVRAGLGGLAAALGLAFLGGLLLNLMPCVFPVLSLKVLGFVESGKDARAHGLLYAAGVVASMWALAGALLLLRAQGQQLGWGFQLQSPVFLALLAAVFVALGLNLLGVFELGVGLTRAGGWAGSGRRGSFFSGALAVVAATPCTAPFMGTALGAALALPPAGALAVFTSLGLGMAFPYAAFAAVPSAGRLLPRPGAWMERLKKALSVPLFLTAAWLLWVLARVVAPAPAAHAGWEPYSDARLEAVLAGGQSAFVDFTADWCVTCQVNERFVLAKPAVREMLARSGAVLLRADWTRKDAATLVALERLGRSGVPVYAIFSPGKAPYLLPTVLTPGVVEKALVETELKGDPL